MLITFAGCLGFNEYMNYAKGILTPEKAFATFKLILLKVGKSQVSQRFYFKSF